LTITPSPTESQSFIDVFGQADAETRELIKLQLSRIDTKDKRDFRLEWWGLIFGLVITLSFLGCATYIILQGQPVAGTILGSIDLVALVAIFVLRRKQQ
jgi:hypothetical protein